MTILLSLIAMVCFGVSDYTGGVVTKKEDPLAAVISREGLELIALLLLIALVVPSQIRPGDMLLGAVAGASAAVGLPTFFHALANGRMGVIAPITGSVSAGLPVIAGLLGGERPPVVQLAGIGFGVVGVTLISMVKDDPALVANAAATKPAATNSVATNSLTDREVPLALLCGLCFGIYLVLIHHTNKGSGLWPSAVGSAVTVVALAIFSSLTTKKFVVSQAALPVNTLGAALDLVGVVAFVYATRGALLSISGVVTSLYPVVTILLAFALLKERFDRVHQAGLAASILALCLISVG